MPVSSEELFRGEGARLWRFVLGVAGGRRELAEDALAEAFALAIQPWTELRDPSAWIARTAYRLLVRELATERLRRPLPPSGDGQFPAEGLQSLMSALMELSPQQRAAVVLHYEQDLPVAEVARVIGTTPATARVHLYRGRQRLRRILGPAPAKEA
jgi:RNA polymerase sigma factor (sigma-70 family)